MFRKFLVCLIRKMLFIVTSLLLHMAIVSLLSWEVRLAISVLLSFFSFDTMLNLKNSSKETNRFEVTASGRNIEASVKVLGNFLLLASVLYSLYLDLFPIGDWNGNLPALDMMHISAICAVLSLFIVLLFRELILKVGIRKCWIKNRTENA